MGEWELGRAYGSSLGEVRWAELGVPGADPVVLLHGTPFSSFIWRGVARALAEEHRVFVWDMPGYGVSEKRAEQDLSLGALARVFVELIEQWELKAPAVVAHDSGGAIALGAHLLDGVAYRRLALVDAVALGPWGSAFFDVVGEHGKVFARLPERLHRALISEYVDTASGPGLRPETRDALVEPWLGDGQAAFYRQLAQRRADPGYIEQMRDRYGEIDIPVLAVWGSADTWVPADRGRELAERIPRAQLRILPGAGHLVQEDRPAELTASLVRFLSG